MEPETTTRIARELQGVIAFGSGMMYCSESETRSALVEVGRREWDFGTPA